MRNATGLECVPSWLKGLKGMVTTLEMSLLLRTRHKFPSDNLTRAPRLAVILSSYPKGEDSIHAKLCLGWNFVFIRLFTNLLPYL